MIINTICQLWKKNIDKNVNFWTPIKLSSVHFINSRKKESTSREEISWIGILQKSLDNEKRLWSCFGKSVILFQPIIHLIHKLKYINFMMVVRKMILKFLSLGPSYILVQSKYNFILIFSCYNELEHFLLIKDYSGLYFWNKANEINIQMFLLSKFLIYW